MQCTLCHERGRAEHAWAVHSAGLCAVQALFFSGLDTLPQGGGGACLPFLKFWVPSAESPSPPPSGGGRPRVGWDFLGKIFVTKIFISPLSSGLPDLVTTLAVLYYIWNAGVLGSNTGR